MSSPKDIQEYMDECIEIYFHPGDNKFAYKHHNIALPYNINQTESISHEYDISRELAIFFLAYGYANESDILKAELINFFNFEAIPEIKRGDSIAANIFLLKIPSHGLKIVTPDWLIYLIEACANGLPGYMQLIYKELLKSINNLKFNNEGIPENYLITTEDFVNCFPNEFPIVADPVIGNKYSCIWDEQKINNHKAYHSDNMCDTNDYWLEVTARS